MTNSILVEGLEDDVSEDILFEIAKLSGYKEKVPTIEQFIDDPYYLGKSLGDGLYPIWRDAAKKVFPNPYYSPYEEIILTGGIGLGKSTFSMLVIMYDICRLLSLKDPIKYYGLLEGTVISYPFINATKGLANTVLWSQFENWVRNSEYFKSKVNTSTKTFFKNEIDVLTASRGRDILGQATIGAIFSEINDMTVVGGQAEDNLDTFTTRRTSRFNSGKEILGHIILDSSSKGNRSFIDARIEEKKKTGKTDYIVFKFAHWEAKWHKGNYSGKMFKVYSGDDNLDPFIMEEKPDQSVLNAINPERVIDVPIEHLDAFRINLIKSLRDLAGVATFGTTSFITSNEVLKATFNRFNPVTKELIVLDFDDRSQKLIDYIDSTTIAFLNKKPRFIHIDLGLVNDSTGIACSYLDDYIQLERTNPITGEKSVQTEPVFITEWVLEIKTQIGKEVPIYKIKDFILDLKNSNIPIELVTTDQFQSSNLRQDLRLKGVPAELLSVDRTKDPYNLWRNLILEKRYFGPYNEKLIREVRELEEGSSKYDHPTQSAAASDGKGSKDLSDACCGSVYACYSNIGNASKVVSSEQMNNILTAISSGNRLSDKEFKDMLAKMGKV